MAIVSYEDITSAHQKERSLLDVNTLSCNSRNSITYVYYLICGSKFVVHFTDIFIPDSFSLIKIILP